MTHTTPTATRYHITRGANGRLRLAITPGATSTAPPEPDPLLTLAPHAPAAPRAEAA